VGIAAANGRVAVAEEAAKALRPPLKWAGGKRWLVPRLRQLYEPYRDRRLVEPLCGGLAIALGLRPYRALLNDISPHAGNFYRRLKRGFRTALAMRNDERLYYRYRDRFNRLIADGRAESDEAAALFYFLNRTGYNGLCRFNSRGEFNVPFGRYAKINYVSDFVEYRATFARWTFSNTDFARVPLNANDFVYADPPMTSCLRATRKRISTGRTRCGWQSSSRATRDRSRSRTRPPSASSSFTIAWGSR
jgi:DNA adenine methylase